jgi:DNA-binding GntR family transcriptional regulator
LANNGNELLGIPTISRKRLGDQIADVLRKQILLGELVPGRNIPERETAEALGVSRTPLREALLILEGEGLVLTAPAKSPIVANPSVEDITQLLLVQSALEGLAGECACEKITADELCQLEAMHEEMLANADQAEALDFFSTDMAFHNAIVAATKNQPLIKTHTQYNSRLWRARFVSSRRRVKRRSITLQEHANIVEGLRLRDKEQTSVALEQHLRDAITNISSVLGNQENQE